MKCCLTGNISILKRVYDALEEAQAEQNELGGDDFDEADDVIGDLNYIPAI